MYESIGSREVPMRASHVDVVVVGAGLAGLSAARQIASAGRSVRVLDARDRVGAARWAMR